MMSALWIGAYLVLWVVVLLVAALVLGLLRRIAAILPEVEARLRAAPTQSLVQEGLPPGAPAPQFEALTADGLTVSDEDLSGAPRIVLLVDEGCKACKGLIEDLRKASWRRTARLVVVADGREVARSIAAGRGFVAAYQLNGTVSEAFQSSITPQAFAIDSQDRIVARDVVGSLAAVERLAEDALKGGEVHIARAGAADVAGAMH